jgi:hypothetical protein
MVIYSSPKMGLDNIPSILALHYQFKLQRSPPTKVSNLHVIFLPQWGFNGKLDFMFLCANANQFYAYT